MLNPKVKSVNEEAFITDEIPEIYTTISNRLGISLEDLLLLNLDPIDEFTKLLTQSADQLARSESDLSAAMNEYQSQILNSPAIKENLQKIREENARIYQKIIADELQKNPIILEMNKKIDKILSLITNQKESSSSVSSKSFELALSVNYDDDEEDEDENNEDTADYDYDLSSW